MNHKSRASSIIKGVGIGMTIGGVSAMIGSNMVGRSSSMTKKNGKKSAAKAIKTVSDMLDNIQYMMK
ncbi:MAG: hypothetical protein FWF05_09085 [Oscillospiraceae bacterium]|nr:hypothetical protein [Oscillospiraceae bacterium]